MKNSINVLFMLMCSLPSLPGSNAEGRLHFPSFKCRNNLTIQFEHFCNGRDDCGDASDEKSHTFVEDPFATWQSCMNGMNNHTGTCLVERDLICKEETVCSNLSPCDLKCDSHFKCQDSSCVSRDTVCDGNSCVGCAEDHGWRSGRGFKCLRSGVTCVLPQQLLHDDISDCDGGADLCFGSKTPLSAYSRNEFQPLENIFREKCFRCLDDAMVIPASQVCNGIIECSDLSDECLCESNERPIICGQVKQYSQQPKSSTNGSDIEEKSTGKRQTQQRSGKSNHNECEPGYVRCKSGKCIRREKVCDGKKDCEDDEGYDYCRGTIRCQDATRYEKECRCGFSCVNFVGTACDGKGDCIIPVPENAHVFGEDTFPEDECEAFCYNEQTNFTCSELHTIVLPQPPYQMSCMPVPISSDVEESTTPSRGFASDYSSDQECNGKQDCPLGDDERNCPDRFRCDVKIPDLMSIRTEQKCDGVEDCVDGADETDELCHETRFRCKSLGGKKVNIDKKLVCDFMLTCDDGSDEINCTDDRFYCENKNPLFVQGRQVFDGRGDCSDWSDECPMNDVKSSRNVFSSRYELIANPLLRVLVWIMGLLALCGNTTVLYREASKLKNYKNLSSIAAANRLLVLNLAASDIIMGIYLMGLGIAGLVMQGHYCSQDLIWRSGSSCITLGVLSVLSSESSVLTMMLLTSCRLYAVIRPFKSSTSPRKRVVCLLILVSWVVSFTIALIPLAPSLSGTFATDAQFEYSPFSRNVQTSIDDARKLFKELMTYDLNPNVTVPDGFEVDKLSWNELESEAKRIFVHEHFKVVKLFGYYSINSVCIPKFFISMSDRAWGYSFFVNLFNFCAFIFVASAYTAIYVHSQKRTALRSSSHTPNDKGTRVLQKKIIRLVITDFCCWIPISIMAFAKLGGADVSSTAYVFAAIVLLPINSALNPLLYSDLPDILIKKLKERFASLKSASTGVETSKSTGYHQEHGTTNTGFESGPNQSSLHGTGGKKNAETRV